METFAPTPDLRGGVQEWNAIRFIRLE